VGGRDVEIGGRQFTVRLAPGAGTTLTIKLRRYANVPTMLRPWE
jgi:hypothetical protein